MKIKNRPDYEKIREASIDYAYDGMAERRGYEYGIDAQGFRAGVQWSLDNLMTTPSQQGATPSEREMEIAQEAVRLSVEDCAKSIHVYVEAHVADLTRQLAEAKKRIIDSGALVSTACFVDGKAKDVADLISLLLSALAEARERERGLRQCVEHYATAPWASVGGVAWYRYDFAKRATDTLAALAASPSEAGKHPDTERLDWLTLNFDPFMKQYLQHYDDTPINGLPHTIRSAIDAARQKG